MCLLWCKWETKIIPLSIPVKHYNITKKHYLRLSVVLHPVVKKKGWISQGKKHKTWKNLKHGALKADRRNNVCYSSFDILLQNTNVTNTMLQVCIQTIPRHDFLYVVTIEVNSFF